MKAARTLLMSLAVIALAGRGQAQLGGDVAACRARWGEPVRVQNDPDGAQSLRFVTNHVVVEISFLDGIARLATYRSDALSVADVMRCLDMNSQGLQWSQWTVSGATEKPGTLHWLRSDDMAMAEQEPGKLTVIASEWLQRPTSPGGAAVTNAVGAEADGVTATNQAPPRLEGDWGNAGSPLAPMTMHLRTDGGVLLTEMSDGGRHDFRARWWWDETARQAIMAMQLPEAGRPTTAPVLAVLVPDAKGNALEVKFTVAATRAYPLLAAWHRHADLHFVRTKGLEAVVVEEPSVRPKQGESRAAVLTRAGKPKGRMTTGDQEVLVYPWGWVWIRQGVVVKVE